MYRTGSEYDEIDKVIIDIYIDYDIHSFPVDEKEVCRKLGVSLVPYSAFDAAGQELLKIKSPHGFFVKEAKDFPPTIYYNDSFSSSGSIRLTIFHELKHYVFEDEDENDDDLADYFARHFMCPTPYLLLKGVSMPNEVVSFCDVSLEAAINACSNIARRERTYGRTLFDYEIRFIEHLEPILLEVEYYKKGGGSVD